MAEETPGVRNKDMLVLAFVLGTLVASVVAGLVVVIYNFEIRRVRVETRRETVILLRFLRDMKRGEQLDVNKDLEVQEVSKQFQGGLGSVVVLKRREERSSIDRTYVNRKINKGEYLMWAHISHEPKDRQSHNMTKPNTE